MGTQENDGFFFRSAAAEDAPLIAEVMREAYAALEDKTLYVADDEPYIRHVLEQREGFAVLAFRGGVLAAYVMFRHPGPADDNLGRDLGFTEAQLLQVMHLETGAVRPGYRGHHLEKRLLEYGDSLVDKNRYHYYLATVSPNNPASLKAAEALGCRVALTKEKYGGLLRHILLKEW